MAGIEAEAEHKALLNSAIQQHLITPANIFILAPTQLDISGVAPRPKLPRARAASFRRSFLPLDLF
jgi:hypothetical protein